MSATLQDKLKASASGDTPKLILPEEPAVTGDIEDIPVGSSLKSITDVVNTPINVITALALASNYEPPKGSFRAIRLKRVVLPNGKKVEPNPYGYYEDAEGDVLKELQYFASVGVVELVE